MFPKTLYPAVGVSLLAGALAVSFVSRPSTTALAASSSTLAYATNGDMLPPTNYREWIYLTSGIDMSYTQKSEGMDHSMFDNVFVNPEAYQGFLKTGTWPDKTIMVLEVREARSKGSINLRGHFQGTDVMDYEVHVKDEARFPGKWAFFTFDSPKGNGSIVPKSAPCYTCHEAHAAVDTTFVQFYPTLLPIAHDKGTLSKSFLQEASVEAK